MRHSTRYLARGLCVLSVLWSAEWRHARRGLAMAQGAPPRGAHAREGRADTELRRERAAARALDRPPTAEALARQRLARRDPFRQPCALIALKREHARLSGWLARAVTGGVYTSPRGRGRRSRAGRSLGRLWPPWAAECCCAGPLLAAARPHRIRGASLAAALPGGRRDAAGRPHDAQATLIGISFGARLPAARQARRPAEHCAARVRWQAALPGRVCRWVCAAHQRPHPRFAITTSDRQHRPPLTVLRVRLLFPSKRLFKRLEEGCAHTPALLIPAPCPHTHAAPAPCLRPRLGRDWAAPPIAASSAGPGCASLTVVRLRTARRTAWPLPGPRSQLRMARTPRVPAR